MPAHRRHLLVGWGHCDPAGMVFYPQYFAWFDQCTAALFAAAGMPLRDLYEAHGILGIPLVDVGARFLAPSRFGDELVAESSVMEWRRSSFLVRHRFFNAGMLAVEGTETRVWTARDPESPGRMKSRPVPQEVIARLAPFHQADEPPPGAK
jgi:4-hydroxybenzoyl-CoA thioesterase